VHVAGTVRYGVLLATAGIRRRHSREVWPNHRYSGGEDGSLKKIALRESERERERDGMTKNICKVFGWLRPVAPWRCCPLFHALIIQNAAIASMDARNCNLTSFSWKVWCH
jgi:hypothetical protein